MGHFRIKDKEVVVGKFKTGNVTESSGLVRLGTLDGHPLDAAAKQNKDRALRGPLAFSMTGCTPPGAVEKSCAGGGLFLPGQAKARGQYLPFLTVEDKGFCVGVCTQHAVPPFPRPHVCSLKISSSNQQATSSPTPPVAANSPPPSPTNPAVAQVDETKKKDTDKKPEKQGAIVAIMGPRFQSIRSLLQFQHPETGKWEQFTDTYTEPADLKHAKPDQICIIGDSIYIPPDLLDKCDGSLKLRIQTPEQMT